MDARKKKVILICVLCVAVLAAGFANFLLTSGGPTENVPVQGDNTKDVSNENAFETFRQERSNVRAQEISYIESVITSEETSNEVKEEAQKQKLALVAYMEAEVNAEGLIKSTLNVDVVVTAKEGSVNVVVDKTELNQEEISKIAEIVRSETNEDPQNIKIMPRSG